MPQHDLTARRVYDREYIRKRRADPAWRARQDWPTIGSRFWARVEKTDTCWLWTGSIDRDGYGRFAIDRSYHRAHRVAYEMLVGPHPLPLDHLCRVRRCVNPAHLEPVTSRENTMRGETPAAANARKTHCPRGHEYTPENTRIGSDGSRNCRACHRELMRRRRERKHLEATS